MSYQVLARKWRPGVFEELVGQQQTAQALSNALESQRLHHAYLFTGTRGVGKTTIARILAKSLNCDKGITATPCGECSSCVEITQGNFVDLLEIDAASKTKVEDTRELLDNVQYRPTRGRYKVYLIDEVHMLSGHSFNALLKTLEEPPPHVVFLLATTDPQKMPVTVLSRCLQFHLKRMEQSDIIDHLRKLLDAEQIEFEPESLQPIAKGADGSMRDALSLLDQAIAFCGEKISVTGVLEMLGSVDSRFAFNLLRAVTSGDVTQLTSCLASIAEYSPDYDDLLSDWLALLYKIALAQTTGNALEDNGEDEVHQFAQSIKAEDIQLFYQLSLHARRDLPYAPHPRQGFEMAMLRVFAFKPSGGSGGAARAKKKLNDSAATASPNLNREQSPELKPATARTQAKNSFEQNARAQGNGQVSAQAARVDLIAEPEAPVVNGLSLVVDNSEVDPETEDVSAQTGATPGSIVLKSEILREESPVSGSAPTMASADDSYVQDSPETLCVEQFPLQEVNASNWYKVVSSIGLNGNANQILASSIGCYQQTGLIITYQSQVESLLTNSTRESIKAALKQYFNDSTLKITLSAGQLNEETPKSRQYRLEELAIDKAEKSLLTDPQVSYLMQKLGATLPRESIKLSRP